LKKTGTQNATVIFDLREAFENGEYFASTSNYVLLYRSATTGNYTEVSSTKALNGASQLAFTISNADWNNGHYTLGTTNEGDSPLIGKTGFTYYSMIKSGDWDDPHVWSLNEFTIDNNGYTPTTSPTSAIDRVVIVSGKTVTISTSNKNNASLEVRGNIALGISTGHSFDEIKGGGSIYHK